MTPWNCPKCRADANIHGKGKCHDKTSLGLIDCYGFVCECDDITSKTHGDTFEDPCTTANCYHCGWSGDFPGKPKSLKSWEKKALDAGWLMPIDRAEELAHELDPN